MPTSEYVLTLTDGHTTVATIDLGAADDDDFGELTSTSGNLYLDLNGVEVGSLWIHRDSSHPVVSLGCFDPIGGEYTVHGTVGLSDPPH